MSVEDIITLANNKKYGLLDEIVHDNKKYFLAIRVIDKNGELEHANESIIVEEIQKDGKIFVKELTDEKLLEEIFEQFSIKLIDEKL